MAWTQKTKSVPISSTVPHTTQVPALIGRAPGIPSFDFSPLELFGAAARCSYLHVVDPSLVTMESTLFSSMIAPHVDDHSNEFFVLPSADTLKDFMKSMFAGSLAQGLAYLAMTRDKYSWVDHFESLLGGAPNTGRAPDFVFGGYGVGVALMESKGTRSASPTAFNATVRDGYKGQVEPHLGHMIGGARATHGYCIGAKLHSSTHADLIVHHTAVPAVRGDDAGDPSEGLGTVQRGNFASAFVLAHSEVLGEAIRGGDERLDYLPFFRFQWRGRHWLTSWTVGSYSYGPGLFRDHYPEFPFSRYPWDQPLIPHASGFAIEERVALKVLETYLSEDIIRPGEEDTLDLPTFHDERRSYEGEYDDGAIFADGLAIVGRKAKIDDIRPSIWSRRDREILLY